MEELHIVALAGGVGGAKLADGLAQVLQPDDLTVIVNTADDFVHLGLHISPDLDTVCYTLAGLANSDTGWGRQNETWNAMQELIQLGMPDWFHLGDSDIATHIARTRWLDEGWALSQITQEFCRSWGVKVKILPMTDETVQTRVHTGEGYLGFQEYFVHRRCEPTVKGFSFEGIETSKAAPGVLEALKNCDVVVICPSNPWVSIDPILTVPTVRSEVEKHMVVAVSPIIGNQTVKGPAAKMFSELGIQPSPLAVAQHYHQILKAILIDTKDRYQVNEIQELDIQPVVTDIFMKDKQDRGRLAKEIVTYIADDLERKSQ